MSSSESSSSPSSGKVLVIPGNDRDGLVGPSGEVDLISRSPRLAGYDWVDPRIIKQIIQFRGSSSVDEFISRVLMLKSDSPTDVVTADSCSLSESGYHGREEANQDFIYIYTCLFTNLHNSLSFDEITMGVLRILNVAPTQLHHNSWVVLQVFQLIYDLFRLRSSPQSFLFYYNSHPTNPMGWLSLSSHLGSILFAPFTSLYKNFKR